MLLSEVTRDVLGAAARAARGVLVRAELRARGGARLPTNLVAAGRDAERSLLVQQRFASDRLRVYSSDDPTGVQVGGALKNVIAIAAGASDGLGFGHNTRAALITRGLAEMARLAVAKGGSVLTLSGLAGLGDLVLTCSAELSRNRTVGFELGRGRQLGRGAVRARARRRGGDDGPERVSSGASAWASICPSPARCTPCCTATSRWREAVRDLLVRPLKKEWE